MQLSFEKLHRTHTHTYIHMYIYPNLIFSLTEEPQKRALRIYLVLLKGYH